MSNELKEGVKLRSVSGPFDNEGDGIFFTTSEKIPESRYCSCESITVSMQNGQMDGVPWARCVRKDGSIAMVNLALMEIVELLEPEA